MNNKFHAISMCTLIAAFAASSWAASSCPNPTEQEPGWAEESGVCYYDMPTTGDASTITIPADLKTFKVRYHGKTKFSHKLNIHCTPQSVPTTVSVSNASLADFAINSAVSDASLSIRNRIDIAALDAAAAAYAFILESFQSEIDMFKAECSGGLCSGGLNVANTEKGIEKVTGFNALSVVFSSTSDEEQSFELAVDQEPYDFGPMQIYYVDGLDVNKINTLVQIAGSNLEASTLALVGSVVAILEAGKANVALIDGSSQYGLMPIPTDIGIDSVYFDRKFTVSGSELYSTLTLPFSISKAKIKNVSNVYAFKNIEGNKAHFTSADMLDAYTPYLIELVDKATGIEFLEGVTLQSSKDKSGKDISTDVQDGQWVFHGTLNYKKWDKNNDADKTVLEGCDGKSCAYGYAASGTYQGQFVRIGDGAYIFPFRAYLFYNKPQSLAPANTSYVLRPTVDIPDEMEIVVDGDNGQTTSIGRFDTRTGEIHINNMKHTYDLKGRRVNGTNNARGAYYGKKVLMK